MVALVEGPASSVSTLKSVFGHIPTAVTVITVGSGPERYGATVGTLAVLSLDPPLLMFAMKEDSALLKRLDAGSPIGINVLSAEQVDIARRFATPGIDRFGVTRWCEEHALPRIDDALAWVPAHVRDRLPLGDHMLITAVIDHAEAEAGAPLVYWQRQFHSLAKLEEREVGSAHPQPHANGAMK